MSEDQTYNGWTNYETWAVGMFLDGNYTGEGTYREVLDVVRATYDHAAVSSQVIEGTWTVEQARKFHLADNLKAYVEETLPELGASLAADLLGAAMSEVNWEELAESKLDEIAEDRS